MPPGRWWPAVVLLLLIVGAGPARSATLKDLQDHYDQGEYRKCLDAATAELEDNRYREGWRTLLVKAHLAVGNYDEAQAALDEALERFPRSIALRWLAHESLSARGDHEGAAQQLRDIDRLAAPSLEYLQSPEILMLLGRAMVKMGIEPKLILDNFYQRCREIDPKYAGGWLASGELALDKHDYALAAQIFENALKEIPEHPDLLHGVARAYAPSDRMVMVGALTEALEANPNHVPSHLLLADHLIDSEQYSEAHSQLGKVFEINPNHPEAWAYKAVLAHLENRPDAEKEARDRALAHWKAYPVVDHLIGLKLSLKYRFKEGAEHQRRALEMDPKFLPARIQLAQDLLRLGDADEGWTLANAVHKEDAYDVTAYNLVTLRDQYQRFATLTNEHFTVRMGARDAEIFGASVLDLLNRARHVLVTKYGATLEQTTLVEIFDDPRDFAVRTFGMPGNPGYLGVCFGDVVTANSPSSPAGKSTAWESVLWHEFCHVVTLNMTKNKMPRWLSEGISVYEELEIDPSWGQRMIPDYRAFILADKMHPVSDLSSAFLTAGSNLDLQFAYYQSALVVEFLVKEYGFEKLKLILNDLGEGTEINEAIARHTEPIKEIDEKFASYARKLARNTGKGFDWNKPEGPVEAAGGLEEQLRGDPRNYFLLMASVQQRAADKEWEKAGELLDVMFTRAEAGFQNPEPYLLRARIARELNEPDKELDALLKAAEVDGNQPDVFERLVEIATDRMDWESVALWSSRSIGMNPYKADAYRSRAGAAVKLDRSENAVADYETMLKLDPLNPAELHFNVARLSSKRELEKARRHVLLALEDAPRFREAHRLLLELDRRRAASAKAEPPAKPPTETGELRFE